MISKDYYGPRPINDAGELACSKGFGLDPIGIIGMHVRWGDGDNDFMVYENTHGYYVKRPLDSMKWLGEIADAPNEDRGTTLNPSFIQALVKGKVIRRKSWRNEFYVYSAGGVVVMAGKPLNYITIEDLLASDWVVEEH